MSVTDPRNLNEHYNELFRKGDLDGLSCLYEEDAVLCPAPGQEVRGRAEIRKRLSDLIALQGDLSTSEQSCVEFENIALLHARWHFVGATDDGKPIRMGGTSSKLARRGPDGVWRYVLDMPVGGIKPQA
jgi:ketosteroid isomerase-like protein